MSNDFLLPDGAGGWRRPNEKKEFVTYDSKTHYNNGLQKKYEALSEISIELFQKCIEHNTGLNSCKTGIDVSQFEELLENLGIDPWKKKSCKMVPLSLYDEEGVEGIECSVCGHQEIHDHQEELPSECSECHRKVEGWL